MSGTGEETRNDVASSGVDWTPTGQLAPELGYFVTPRFMLGVQGRLQLVRGATPYHVPNPDTGECGDDNICSPAKGALAALAKATWFLADAGSAFQPYLSLSAGGGTIRHVSKVAGPASCGSGTEVCMDTVAGGPALFGPGVGFRYGFSDARRDRRRDRRAGGRAEFHCQCGPEHRRRLPALTATGFRVVRLVIRRIRRRARSAA